MGFYHSASFVGLYILLCFYVIKNFEMNWEFITIEKIAKSNEKYISTEILLFFRILFAIITLGTTLISVLDKNGQIADMPDRNGKIIKFKIISFLRLTFFTYWCWLLQGIYFSLTSLITLHYYNYINLNLFFNNYFINKILQFIWVAYEV